MSTDDNLFTRLSVARAIKRAFNLFFHRLGVFLPIGVAESIPLFALSGVLLYMANKTLPGTSQQKQEFPKGALVSILLFYPLSIAVIIIGSGATIRATAEIYAGKQPQLLSCLKEGFRRACTLFLFVFLLVVACFGFFMIAWTVVFVLFVIIVGDKTPSQQQYAYVILLVIFLPIYFILYLYVVVAVEMTPPSIVLENKSALGAIERSWELVTGSRCYVFCTIFLLSLLNIVLNLIANYSFGSAGPFVSNVWNLVAMPVSSILGTVLFFSLRVEKEGLNHETLLRELGFTDQAEGLLVSNYEPLTSVEEEESEEEGAEVV